jgi:hypothetical protein
VSPRFFFAARRFLRVFWRVSRQLFHETTGALFGILAVVWASSAWREWHHGAAQWMIALSLIFAVMMAVFAAGSFRRARRVPQDN